MSLITKLVDAWKINVSTLAKASRSRWEENGMPPVLDSSFWEVPTIDLSAIELIEDALGFVFPTELTDFFQHTNGIKMPGFGADGELLEASKICNFINSEAISLANRNQYENKYSGVPGFNYSHSPALAPLNSIRNSFLVSDDAECNKSVILMVPIKGKDVRFLYEEVWYGSAKFLTFFELFKFVTEQNLRALKSQLM